MKHLTTRLITRALIALLSPTAAHAETPAVCNALYCGKRLIPVFPRSGGELCCCPTQWYTERDGKLYCQLPDDWDNAPAISQGQWGAPITRPEQRK